MRKYIGEASYAEQIQAEQYEEVMSYASVNMRFDYSIPVEEFIKENDISDSVNLGDLTNFTSIGFSDSEYRKSIYPGQKYRDALSYYRG